MVCTPAVGTGIYLIVVLSLALTWATPTAAQVNSVSQSACIAIGNGNSIDCSGATFSFHVEQVDIETVKGYAMQWLRAVETRLRAQHVDLSSRFEDLAQEFADQHDVVKNLILKSDLVRRTTDSQGLALATLNSTVDDQREDFVRTMNAVVGLDVKTRATELALERLDQDIRDLKKQLARSYGRERWRRWVRLEYEYATWRGQDLQSVLAGGGFRVPGALVVGAGIQAIWTRGRDSGTVIGGEPNSRPLDSVDGVRLRGAGLSLGLECGYEWTFVLVAVEPELRLNRWYIDGPDLPSDKAWTTDAGAKLLAGLRLVDGVFVEALAGAAWSIRRPLLRYEYDLVGSQLLHSEVKASGLQISGGIGVRYAWN